MKKQVHLTHHAFLQPHRDGDQRLKAGFGTLARQSVAGAGHGMDRNHLESDGRVTAATKAVTGVDALLGIHHGSGQAMGGEHQVALVALA